MDSMNSERRSLKKKDSIILRSEFEDIFSGFGKELENWALSEERSEITEKNVIPRGYISSFSEEDMIRHLDPETVELTFRGDTYDLMAYYEEILELKEKIEEMSRGAFGIEIQNDV